MSGSRPLAPPTGQAPPASATLHGRRVALAPLAEAIADRYFEEFPDDLERYAPAARDWEVHDTAWCLHWAVLDVEGFASLAREIGWLTDVLGSRGFPLDHLARNLEVAGDVVAELVSGAGDVAERLHAAAAQVRAAASSA